MKNEVRYKILAIIAERDPYDDESETFVTAQGATESPEDMSFTMIAVDAEDKPVGDSFVLTHDELGSKLWLSHTITYFSSQARTIHGALCLAQTGSKHFPLRHLTVG